MSTTAKIDFPPGLFDEVVVQQEALDPPPVGPQANNAKVGMIMGWALVAAVLILAILALGAGRRTPQPAPVFPLETVGQPVAVSPPSLGSAGGFCDGHEIICATTTTDQPVDLLQKLAAAMPQGTAKSYQVRLSVIPADE